MEAGTKKALHIFLICSAIFTMLIAFNHCGKTTTQNFSNPSQVTSETYNAGLPNTNGQGSPSALTVEEVHVGVKNFEEINETMAHLTKVPKSQVASFFFQYKLALPGSHNIKTFQTINQLAITKLASQYCEKLINNNTYRSAIWPTYNFSLTPPYAFTETNRNILITEALKKFWILTDSELANYSSEMQELDSLIDDLLVNLSLYSITSTRNVTKGVCTAVLSSAKVTIL